MPRILPILSSLKRILCVRKNLLRALVFIATPAHAVNLDLMGGEVRGSLDTTVSYGVLIRTQSRDPALTGNLSGGRSGANNADDGNLTYDRGDTVSSLFRINSELELNWRQFSLFARTLLFYDPAIRSRPVNPAPTGPGLTPEARERLKDDARLLDLYVSGRFDLGQRQTQVRLGRQVINWGESLFIPNGVNVINPVDVTRLRAPGSEIKDALLPQEMVWASQELNARLSAEAFYQFKWRETRIDPRGSFFSTTDTISPGGQQLQGALPYRRNRDREPGDTGQYGAALRLLMPEWNNAELGAYYVRYHSRTPYFSTARVGSGAGAQRFFFADYPEDIGVLGLSLSTALRNGTSLQAEYAYRPSMPLQIATTELVLAAAGVATNQSGYSGQEPGDFTYTGYRNVKMHQVQSAATHSLGPRLGASQVVLIGEVGLTWLDLPDDPTLKFDGPATFTPAATPGNPNASGYATRRSWGYRTLARAEYPNALFSATLIPRVAFSHDVRGVGPTFNQGVQSVSVGLTGVLRQAWQADVAYVRFMGGRTYANPATGAMSSANFLKDRDFISATVSYAF